jgi:hypothetical protein
MYLKTAIVGLINNDLQFMDYQEALAKKYKH